MEQYIPWLISAGSLLIAYLTFAKNEKKDAKREVEHIGKLNEGILKLSIKMDQVCATTTETRNDVKNMNQTIMDHDKRLTIVERDLKSAFRKIDEIRSEERG